MSTSHLLDNLELMHAETLALLSTAATLDDASITAPSLCEGWTRAHVVTHIARNADAICNLVALGDHRRADTDVRLARSPATPTSPRGRGARPPTRSRTWSPRPPAWPRWHPRWPGPPEDREVEMRGGRVVPGRDLPTLRLREVVFHHVDLDLGYTFADADAGFVERTLRRAVATLTDNPAAPSLRLRSDEGDVLVGRRRRDVRHRYPGRPAALARPRPPGRGQHATGRCRRCHPGDDVPGIARRPDRRPGAPRPDRTGQASADSRLTPALRASATAPSAEWTLSLDRMLCTCVRTVLGETLSSSPIWVRDSPSIRP